MISNGFILIPALCIIVTVNVLWMYHNFALVFSVSPTLRNTSVEIVPIKVTHENRNRPTSHLCVPKNLVGALRINFTEMQTNYDYLTALNSDDMDKLVFEPKLCKPMFAVAIIVPFRDRQQHLEYFLGHLHPVLKIQLCRFQIFVIEQNGNDTFNKGRLMNTGFDFAKNIYQYHFDCYIFHDVDLLLENNRNIYTCGWKTNKVRHLSCAINKFRYRFLCCGMTVGGVVSFTGEQFIKVNGYPNDYWGWGGEDDDMNSRIKAKRLKISRPARKRCRYTMIKHDRDKLNRYVQSDVDERVQKAKQGSHQTGLSNLNTIITKVKRKPLYVHVYVDVGDSPMLQEPTLITNTTSTQLTG